MQSDPFRLDAHLGPIVLHSFHIVHSLFCPFEAIEHIQQEFELLRTHYIEGVFFHAFIRCDFPFIVTC
jgi:hypothetical protein